MVSFSEYLEFALSPFNLLFQEETSKPAKISSNDKGVLHELLVGRELNALADNKESASNGFHMSQEAKEKHDEIRSKITPEEYEHHEHLARTTAIEIFRHAKGNVKSAHWTSKPGDIERLTGKKESQQENPSDIMIKHAVGSHTGYSLKVTQKKYGKVPVGNPGAKQTDKQLGISRNSEENDHYENARKELEERHPILKGKGKAEQKAMVKANPDLRKTADALSTKAIGKIRDEWYQKLVEMPKDKLSDHIRNNLLHAHVTKSPMFKVTTGGSTADHSVEIEHPETHYDHILKNPERISVHKSGNNSIEFKFTDPTTGKTKTFLRHRIKPESTPVVTSLKGSAEQF